MNNVNNLQRKVLKIRRENNSNVRGSKLVFKIDHECHIVGLIDYKIINYNLPLHSHNFINKNISNYNLSDAPLLIFNAEFEMEAWKLINYIINIRIQ